MASVAFPQPLIEATFLARRKRFLADMRLPDGREVVAHCPNTGTMKTCLEPGAPSLIRETDDPKRKTRYSWLATRIGGVWIGIDTSLPNRLVERAILEEELPGLEDYPIVRRERKIGKHSRIDLLLESDERRCWVEVKNVTMVHDGVAAFPDAVTTRGQKHLLELMEKVHEGDAAAMVYVVQRADAGIFRPADDIDPDYGHLMRKAHKVGVKLLAVSCTVSPEGVRTEGLLPVDVSL